MHLHEMVVELVATEAGVTAKLAGVVFGACLDM
jgi:hypothetical protein